MYTHIVLSIFQWCDEWKSREEKEEAAAVRGVALHAESDHCSHCNRVDVAQKQHQETDESHGSSNRLIKSNIMLHVVYTSLLSFH